MQQIFEIGPTLIKETAMSITILRKNKDSKWRKWCPKRKARSFEEKEISLLIAEWIKYPCLYKKGNRNYHDRNKRDISKLQIANSLNEALGYDEDGNKAITGN